ncbi:MAG: hypothetical protein JWP97_3807 [Labilithrix sp.]|nr:hypothetical protein [Labilithrix sp.]
MAKRCLCLELLLQRLGLEIDDEDDETEREAIRRAWSSRLGQLGLEDTLQDDERALLDRPVGELTEEECDDIEGRVIGALVLLWSLTRLGARPTAATLGIATRLIGDHGVLGDGSIPGAKAAIEKAVLRPEQDVLAALETYTKDAAKPAADVGGEPDPEPMVAAIGKTTLEWIIV